MENKTQSREYNEAEKPETLQKSLKLFDLFTIGFGAIVGVGWVVVVGDWINIGGGPLATALAFVVGAAVLIPIAKAFGELSAAIPVAGGCVVYTQRAFGKKAAFFAGWFLTLAYVMMCPWEVIAIGQLAETLIPALKTVPLYSVGEYTIYLPSIILCLVIAAIVFFLNHSGVEKVSKLQNVLVLILLSISSLAIILAIIIGKTSNLLPMVDSTPENESGSFISGFITMLCMTPFFFSGFDTLGQEAEEVDENEDFGKMGKLPKIAVISSAGFYVLVIMAISMLLPWKLLLSLQMPAAEAFAVRGINIMKISVILGAFAGLFTTLNSFYVAGARVLLSMGRERMLPDFFSKLHEKHKTPVVCNYLILMLCLIAPFLGKSILLPITNVCSFGFLLSWLMVALSDIRIKKLSPDIKWPFTASSASNKMAIILSVIMILLLILPMSPGALTWPLEIGIVVIWLLFGIFFMMFRNKNNR